MKSVYVVLCGGYDRKPVAVAYNKDNAVKLASDLYQAISIEASDFDETQYVKEVSIIDSEQTFDINDLISTAIISTQKAYEPYLRTVDQPIPTIEIEN